jgi:hypothetical protein
MAKWGWRSRWLLPILLELVILSDDMIWVRKRFSRQLIGNSLVPQIAACFRVLRCNLDSTYSLLDIRCTSDQAFASHGAPPCGRITSGALWEPEYRW